MRLQDCKLYDRNNALAGVVKMPPNSIDAVPRRIQFQGRTFIEGDGSGFYGENEFAEVVDV
jgi:hypothetical protein